jgi:DMSO/TMAO reductase YedYZ molybdopterin-dependent catalytic subunit
VVLVDRRLRSSEGAVAGAGATLVATALLWAAHLVQAGVPFAPISIAQRALRVIPGRVAVFFIEALGHWALRSFVIGVLLATLALGAAAGAWVGRRPPEARGRATWLAGGLLTLLAAAGWTATPGGMSLIGYLLLAAVAGAVWVLVLRGALDRLARDPVPASSAGRRSDPVWERPEAPVGGLGRTRREFLRAAAGAGGLVLAAIGVEKVLGSFGDRGGRPLARPAGAGQLAEVGVPAESQAQRAAFELAGLTPEVTPNGEHYTVDESIIDPDVDASTWRLRVDGLVGRPVELGYDELLRMASAEQFVTLQCISNEVGGDLVGTARWTGVPLRDVLERAGGPGAGAVRVVFHAVGGYTDSILVATALDPATMVAYGMNGLSLPRSHGYPARIIAPGIYGMKNVKWLRRIQVVDYDYQGYWQRSGGWDNIAEIRTASRIDLPGGDEPVQSPVTVAGVAWAGRRGIAKVEVSADGGATWRAATLRRQLAEAAWRQWRLDLDRAQLPDRPGDLRLLVRAVDGTGAVQTEARARPLPSGSSGWDEVRIRVVPRG